MAARCLICDESIPEGTNGACNSLPTTPPHPKKRPRSSEPSNTNPLPGDTKSKFILTSSQYTVLQKVLTLPEGVCKEVLSLGPYCRDCFTNINNVCHCMSALENLQQSVVEFRKDFGSKIQKSCEKEVLPVAVGNKRKGPSGAATAAARSTILSCLSTGVFKTEFAPAISFNKNIHRIISNMDPNVMPETEIESDLILRTTNGNLPLKKSKSKPKPKAAPPAPARKGSKGRVLPKLKFNFNKSASQDVKAVPEEGGKGSSAGQQKCWICGQGFPTSEELEEHEKAFHRFQCEECPKVFYSKLSLDGHKLKVHCTSADKGKGVPSYIVPAPAFQKKKKRRPYKGGSSLRGKKFVKCSFCDKKFTKNGNLVAHYKKFHHDPHSATAAAACNGNGDEPASSGIVENGESKRSKNARPGRCRFCKKIVMDVKLHIQQTHPETIKVQSPEKQLSKVEETESNSQPSEITQKKPVFDTAFYRSIEQQQQRETLDSSRSSSKADPSESAEVKTEPQPTDNVAQAQSIPAPSSSPSTSTSASPPSAKEDPPKPKAKALNFNIPFFSNLSSAKSQSSSATSKYQFKNLLKEDTP